MSMQVGKVEDPKDPDHLKKSGRYYVWEGQSHDAILRCNECKNIVKYESLVRHGVCPKCGNRRMREVIALSFWEWLRIRLGLLRFAHRDKFLKEFKFW